jgi:hypothetical protein
MGEIEIYMPPDKFLVIVLSSATALVAFIYMILDF